MRENKIIESELRNIRDSVRRIWQVSQEIDSFTRRERAKFRTAITFLIDEGSRVRNTAINQSDPDTISRLNYHMRGIEELLNSMPQPVSSSIVDWCNQAARIIKEMDAMNRKVMNANEEV